MASNNKYSNGNPKVPSIWSVIPSKRVVDDRSKQYPTTFLVFCCLAMFTNRAGTCFPNQETIARHLGVSRSAVSQHIKKLIEWDYIRHAKTRHKGLKGNKYYMVFDDMVEEEEALSVQTSETVSEISEVIPPTIEQGARMYEKIKPTKEARTILLLFKDIVRKYYGHQALHTTAHEELVTMWLQDFTKEEILKKMEDTIRYRMKNNKDSIKSVVYFKNVFVKDNKKPSNPKQELEGLMSKFVNTHKVKF